MTAMTTLLRSLERSSNSLVVTAPVASFNALLPVVGEHRLDESNSALRGPNSADRAVRGLKIVEAHPLPVLGEVEVE